MKRILLVFPHPDDETFMCGGTVAKYVKVGWDVQLLCATRGEGGSRERELAKATEILGITQVRFLDYKDGTLPGVNPGELEDKVYRTMIGTTPHAVITFEPGGVTNHPDHIKLTRAVTVAFQNYANATVIVKEKNISPTNPPRHPRDRWQIEFAEALRDDVAPKLYYACMPESIVHFLVNKKKVYPQESFGKPWSAIADKHITTVIDTRSYQAKKIQALRAHETQREAVDRYVSVSPNTLLQKEFFVLRMQGVHEVFMGKNDHIANKL